MDMINYESLDLTRYESENGNPISFDCLIIRLVVWLFGFLFKIKVCVVTACDCLPS
jgi:hypothetical protein